MKSKFNHKEFLFAKEEIKNGDIKKAIEIYESLIQENIEIQEVLFDPFFIPTLYRSEKNNEKLNHYIKFKNCFSTREQIKHIASEYYNLITNYLDIKIDVNNPIFIRLDKAKTKIKQNEEYESFHAIYLFQHGCEIDENNSDAPSKINLSDADKNIEKLFLYNFNHNLNWGQYINNSVKDIFYKDQNYILWCVVNLDHFAIDSNFFLLDEIKSEPLYYKALEINLIKNLIIKKWKIDELDHSRNEPYRYTDSDTFRDAFDSDIDAWLQFND